MGLELLGGNRVDCRCRVAFVAIPFAAAAAAAAAVAAVRVATVPFRVPCGYHLRITRNHRFISSNMCIVVERSTSYNTI